jgi:hypothetical protein
LALEDDPQITSALLGAVATSTPEVRNAVREGLFAHRDRGRF